MIDWFSITQNQNDYTIKISATKDKYSKPLEAAHYNIDFICKNYPPPYTLMLSGGVDSQAMLYAWHTSGKKFETFSGVYNFNLNDQDLSCLKEFSQKNNISVNFVDFDLLNFLETEHISYVYRYRCGSPHMTTFMKMSEMITEGTVLLSGNFIHPFSRKPLIDKNNFGLYKYAKISNKNMVPYFFCETEELAYSFKYNQQQVHRAYGHENSQPADLEYNKSSYDQKVTLYQVNEFPVIKQEYKMTGFEKVKDYYDEKYKHLITNQMILARTFATQTSKRTFDLLLRNKYEREFLKDKYDFIVR